jgi:hypothetical protein
MQVLATSNGSNERSGGAHRILKDRHQLTLERAVVTLSPLLQSIHQFIGRILDRQADRHERLQNGSNSELE